MLYLHLPHAIGTDTEVDKVDNQLGYEVAMMARICMYIIRLILVLHEPLEQDMLMNEDQ